MLFTVLLSRQLCYLWLLYSNILRVFQGQLLPEPLCYTGDILQHVSSYEVYLLLVNIWTYVKVCHAWTYVKVCHVLCNILWYTAALSFAKKPSLSCLCLRTEDDLMYNKIKVKMISVRSHREVNAKFECHFFVLWHLVARGVKVTCNIFVDISSLY